MANNEYAASMSQIIKNAIKQQQISQQQLAERLGYKTQSAISERLRGDLRVGTAIKILDYLGYDMIIVDRNDRENSWKVVEPKTLTQSDGILKGESDQ